MPTTNVGQNQFAFATLEPSNTTYLPYCSLASFVVKSRAALRLAAARAGRDEDDCVKRSDPSKDDDDDAELDGSDFISVAALRASASSHQRRASARASPSSRARRPQTVTSLGALPT